MEMDDVQQLRKELARYQRVLSTKENEIRILNTNLQAASEKLSFTETENLSLKRLVERGNTENDQLLQQLDSQSKSVQYYEDNELTIKEELAILKEHLTESTMARDNVIEKLKDVSIETGELIDKCERSYEENKLFKIKIEELEKENKTLRQQNESLSNENKNFQIKLETRNMEIETLQCKLESFNSQSSSEFHDLWQNNILTANNELQSIEHQIKTIISNLKNAIVAKQNLKEELERVKSTNIILQEQNTIKDKQICKQNKDFFEVKATVDKYYSEILRLDRELKDCHRRVATLNENLEMINSENLDVVEFVHFKRSLLRFGNLENIESLLSKLQVLQEIEQFFEKNLSRHVESTTESEPNESVVTDKKQDTINKIKNYLEKALSAIEKLNDKMTRLRTEYENKLHAKSGEISTLREVLSNAILYNKILEQTLQQYKDNVQLDKTISNETDELLIVNETLLDGFDTLKQIYRVSENSNSFLHAKAEQLKSFIKLVELYVRRLTISDKSSFETYMCKIEELFSLMRDIFEEIRMNEPSPQKVIECQQVIEKFEKNLIAKDYLKHTVENMSQEVKRLTSKVEHEMAEKIREVEALKSEVDNVKTDNRELVGKIKSCNREIVSLSTENYDLSEKLENLTKIENRCELLKQELEKVKKRMTADAEGRSQNNGQLCDVSEKIENLNDVSEKIKNLNDVCSTVKSEHNDIRWVVVKYFEENECVIKEAQKLLGVYAADNSTVDLHEKRCDIDENPTHLGEYAIQLLEKISKNLSALVERLSNEDSSCDEETSRANLMSLKNTCINLTNENERLRADISVLVKVIRDVMLSHLRSTLNQVLENMETCSEVENNQAVMSNVASMSDEVGNFSKEIRSVCEEMLVDLEKQMRVMVHEFQKAVFFKFEKIKSTLTISNDEMIKEMQEMNTELKKRGETISNLTQDFDKEKKYTLEQISQKENIIIELNEKLTSQLKELESEKQHVDNIRTEMESLQSQCSSELKQKSEQIENLSVELENLNSQIRSRDDTIVTLRNDIQKQKEMHDGDVSSVGTISKSEEASRLKDVEDTFEERYMKLKIIALKMKKNITDLNQELKSEKNERAALQCKMTAVAKQAKTSQALQEECDRLNDDLDLKENEIKELKKIIQASDKGGEDLKSQLEELRTKVETSEKNFISLQNEKSELEIKLKLSANQFETVNQEKQVDEIVKREKDKEIQQLKSKLKEVEEAKMKVENELDQVKKEVRKQGALNLEMLDYEKTISDLRAEVEDKEVQIRGLRVKLTSTTDGNATMVERIKQMEEQVASYIASNKTADNEILTLNKTINECEHNLKEKDARLKEAILLLESEKSKNEDLLLQLANSASETKCLTKTLRGRETSLAEQVKSLSSKLFVVEDKLRRQENESSQLKEEYESYKARAHNLLQKMKSENNVKSNEQKLQMEIDTMSQTAKDLRKRLDGTLTELNNQKVQQTLVENAKEKLQNRVKELTNSLSEKSDELEAIRAEYRAYKLNNETIVNCYKAEIESVKTALEDMKIELRKSSLKSKETQMEDSDTPIDHIGRNETPNECCENGTMCNLSSGSHDSELESIDEAKTFGGRRKHSLVPLDKLLQPPKEEKELELCNVNDSELRGKIKSLEEQVKYLTIILNESENNAARNEHLVALLKEELRRCQRMFEREPHLQNTEYLKNIVIKFVTLPLGDEKSQLVTVLETILKLTPNERQTLSAIAKGQKLDQKGGSGWASYLGW